MRTAARLSIALATLLGGCFAAAPPAAVSTDLGACHPGAYQSLSEHRCGSDADCVLCATEPGCAELRSRRELWLDNAPCPPIPPGACGGAAARCCLGRCVRSLGPPPL